MKKNMRIIIDIILFIMFILLMGYHITGNAIHEILGVITFILFIVHHIINLRWYKMIFKGMYNFYRIVQMIFNTLLFLAMIGIMISSVMISSNVFSFLNFKTTMFFRRLHMISTSWGFVLMAIHLGLHLNIFLTRLNQKMRNNTFEYVYYLIMILFMIFGVYAFIKTELWKDMFLVNQFKFFDYDQSPYLFYSGEIAITFFVSLMTYLIIKMLKKIKKEYDTKK